MNIGHTLSQSVRSFPDRPAIAYGGQVTAYARFNQRANRFANALHRLGVARGDHVAILMYNCPEMLEALYGCFKLGCAAVPINFRLHPKEFAFIIDHSEAKAVIVSSDFNEPLSEVRGLIAGVSHPITTEGAFGDFLDYESLLAGEAEHWVDVEVEPDDSAKRSGHEEGARFWAQGWIRRPSSLVTDRTTSISQSSRVIVHRLRPAIRRRDRDRKAGHEDGARFSEPGWTRGQRSLGTDPVTSTGQSSRVFVHRLRPAIRRTDRDTKAGHEDGARFSEPGWIRRRSSLVNDLICIMNPTRKSHRSQLHRKPYRPHRLRLRSWR